MTRLETLDAAKTIVVGEREAQYGSPENNFQIIANLWMDYLAGAGTPVDLSPHDVAIMMTLLKVARIASGRTHDDNYVDACGYLACAAELETER